MMRSWLFVPADSSRKIGKAQESQADILILDLEDSVAPGAKPSARRIAVETLDAGPRKKPLFVRINAFASGQLEDDLVAVVPARPDGIVLPKAEGLASIERLSGILRVHEARAGLPDGAIPILPIVTETAVGVFAAASVGAGHARLCGVTWGAEDLSADLGARSSRGPDGQLTGTFAMARAVTLLVGAAARTPAIDTVFVDFRDAGGLLRECENAARDGFAGKLAIHPDQAPEINEAFTPSADAMEEAQAVIDAFAAAGGAGVVAIDGRMYDVPHLRRARRLLERAGKLQAAAGPE